MEYRFIKLLPFHLNLECINLAAQKKWFGWNNLYIARLIV